MILAYFGLLTGHSGLAYLNKISLISLAASVFVGMLMVRALWKRAAPDEGPVVVPWRIASIIGATLFAGMLPLLFILWGHMP